MTTLSADPALDAARSAMATFERMWAGMRVLPADHPNRQPLLSLFLDALKPCLEGGRSLTLEVEPTAFMLGGQEVLKLERASDNYVSGLHQDGVRRLAFDAGLTAQALARFFEILRTSFVDRRFAEDDLVTLLWEARLEGLSYEATDLFDEVGVAESGAETTADAVMAAVTTAQKVGPTARGGRDADGRSELSPAEKRALLERLTPPDRVVGAKLGEVLFALVRELPTVGPEVGERAFQAFVLDCLRGGSLEPVLSAVAAIDAVAGVPGGVPAQKRLFAVLEAPACVAALVERVVSGTAQDATQKLLKFVGVAAFPALWGQLMSAQDPAVKKQLLAQIEPYADQNRPFLVQQLTKGDEVAALLAVSMLRKGPLAAVARELVVGLRHSAAAVRVEVINTLRKVDDPVVRQILPYLLKDTEMAVRMAVIDMMARAATPGTEEQLLAVVKDPEFGRRDEEEQKLTLSGLGRVATAKSLPTIRDLAVGEYLTVERTVRMTALRVLGEKGDAECATALDKLAKAMFGNKELKEAARRAVEAIARRGAVR